MEEKQARLTLLIDREQKSNFDALCSSRDETTSEVVRRLIAEFLVRHGAHDPAGTGEAGTS